MNLNGGAVQAQQQSSSIGYANAPEYGVTSAIKELAGELTCLKGNAEELRSTLGISVPKDAGNKEMEPKSLVQIVQSMVYVVRTANSDLTDCLRHLNT